MTSETHKIQKIAKKLLSKETLKKIKSLDEEEKPHALQYSIISKLKLQHHELEKQIKELESQNKHLFYAKVKSALVPSKIKHFSIDFSNEEFYKLENLLNDIKKEIENVRTG